MAQQSWVLSLRYSSFGYSSLLIFVTLEQCIIIITYYYFIVNKNLSGFDIW